MAIICAFGDSITWGSWDPEGGGWVNRLQRHFISESPNSESGALVYNHGIPGDTAAGVLSRISGEANARHPDVILVAVGINDIATLSVDEFAMTYNLLVETAVGLADRVVLIGLTNTVLPDLRPAKAIEAFNEAIASTAARFHLGFVNPYGQLAPGDLIADGLHPGASGHHKLFSLLKDAL